MKNSYKGKNRKVEIKESKQNEFEINEDSNQYELAIINGFVRQKVNIWIPNDIIKLLFLFYGIGYNIFNSKCKLETNDCQTISQLYINKNSLFYLSASNTLYVCGDNVSNQLGLKHSNENYGFTIHQRFNIMGVKLVSSGLMNSHCFIYTLDNQLYGFGETHSLTCSRLPFITKFDSNIIQITCGAQHTLLLTKNGSVYGCGLNNHGQLSKQKPYDNNKGFIYQIKRFSDIIGINCTAYSSYVYSKDHILTSFGCNTDGELGINDRSMNWTTKPRAINIPDGVSQFDCGSFHVGCVNKHGIVFTFGNNRQGGCGILHLHVRKVHAPFKIILSDKIEWIKCGYSHNILKTINADYYSFGSNNNNECLINDDKQRISCQKIDIQKICIKTGSHKPIVNIVPGNDETFIFQTLY